MQRVVGRFCRDKMLYIFISLSQ